jgi:AbiV family abortive infection protein
MKLSSTDLLHGAIYAVEQAGHLLHDAVALYEQRRYSSAVVLAVFCREELGRANILLATRKRALTSSPVSAKSVQNHCEQHVEKLRHGQTGVTLRWGRGQSGKFKALFGNPQTAEYKEAHRMVAEITNHKARRDPHDIHQRRCRALYVEPSEAARKWNRPCEMTQEESRQLLEDVANDYALCRDSLQTRDDELAAAIAQWQDCPRLPDTIWPLWPAVPG